MAKPVIIVESPTKARSIAKYLAHKYTVIASKGHVRDLPKTKMGVDVDNGFEPNYITLRDKKDVITAIKKAAKDAPVVLLAPDPDREGEAIAWHIHEIVQKVNPNVKRVLFNEITERGISAGLDSPRDLDRFLFESQQARRIVDRLVGYELSPLLWKKVRRGLSAGRVQSVALRLIVEREKEILAFDPREYWAVSVELRHENGEVFRALLAKIDGKKAVVPDGAAAQAVVAEIEGDYLVSAVTKKRSVRKAPPPFITSTLQQESSKRYYFPAKKTMMLAQKLYEGIELGKTGDLRGLITYMRTDSTRVSEEALSAVRVYVEDRFGKAYLPDKPNIYKTKKGAQDAHEAIRPTDVSLTPERVEAEILASGANAADARNLAKLYELIWRRFVASQMLDALFDVTSVEIDRGRLTFRCQGQVEAFKGFRAIYADKQEQSGTGDAGGEEGEMGPSLLPPFEEGMNPAFVSYQSEQRFTQPPARFSEATLIKELEERGIGRPSTYATIISTLTNRKYMVRESRRFQPTELGTIVTDLLTDAFPDILNVEFTASMEEKLDAVEENKVHWRELLGEFYQNFHSHLIAAQEGMPNLRAQIVETDIPCDRCGAQMVIRWGTNGKFLACATYPKCKNTKEFNQDGQGNITIVQPEMRDEVCPICGKPMVKKQGKFGIFLGCSDYPECKGTLPYILPYSCPEDGCDGKLIQRRSKKGKTFYGCSNYSSSGDGCSFSTWDEPVEEPCPACEHPYLFRKKSRRREATVLYCVKCSFRKNE